MLIVTRRDGIRALVALPGLLLLADCAASGSGTTNPVNLNTIGTDAELIANGVSAIANAVAATLPANSKNQPTLTEIEGIAVEVGKDATALQTAPASTSTVTDIVTEVQTLDPIVAELYPPAAPAIGILNAILSLLPTFLAQAGIPTTKFAARKLATMSQLEARNVLLRLPARAPDHR